MAGNTDKLVSVQNFSLDRPKISKKVDGRFVMKNNILLYINQYVTDEANR